MEWLQESESVRVGTRADIVVIEWPGILRLQATAMQDVADIETLSEVDSKTMHKLRCGLARAVPSYLRGQVVLHASSVAVENRGLIIAGVRGAGKSTIAAALCARGAGLLADDSTVVDVRTTALMVDALERDHWLGEDSRRVLGLSTEAEDEKVPIASSRVAVACPLNVLVVLHTHNEEKVVATRQRGINAVRTVLDHAFRLPLRDRALRDCDAFVGLAKTIPIYNVYRPRTFSHDSLTELAIQLEQLLVGGLVGPCCRQVDSRPSCESRVETR